MSGRIYPSVVEAIHGTAVSYRPGMKYLAAEIGMSPPELSHRTTLGGESARSFPANDEHLLKMLRVTGDHSVLLTLCELLGYEPPQPKKERIGELVVGLTQEAARLQERLQLVMDFMKDEKKAKR